MFSNPGSMCISSLYTNLHYISKTPPDCSLVSFEGVHIPTQQHLLAAASSYLACLLAQGCTTTPTIILPFTTKVVRKIIQVLGEKEGNTIDSEAFLAARELGIMFLKKEVTNHDIGLRYGSNIHPNPFFEESIKNYENSASELFVPKHGGKTLKHTAETLPVFERKKETRKKYPPTPEDHDFNYSNTLEQENKETQDTFPLKNKKQVKKVKSKRDRIDKNLRKANIQNVNLDQSICCEQNSKGVKNPSNIDAHMKSLLYQYFDFSAGSRKNCITHPKTSTRCLACELCGKSFKTNMEKAKNKKSCHTTNKRLASRTKQQEKKKFGTSGQSFAKKETMKRPQTVNNTDEQFPPSYLRSDNLTNSSDISSCNESKQKEHNHILLSKTPTDKYAKYKIKYMKYFNLICNK